MCVCKYIQMHVCIYMCVYICIYIYIYISHVSCTFGKGLTCARTRLMTCVHITTYIYIYIYAYHMHQTRKQTVDIHTQGECKQLYSLFLTYNPIGTEISCV